MKYKNFKAGDNKDVEKQINEWLKGKSIKFERSDSSIGTVSVPGRDDKGKKVSKKVAYVSVNVWYEEK
jgi:hypothetical protein